MSEVILQTLQQRITELVPFVPDETESSNTFRLLVADMMSLTLDIALEQQNMIQEMLECDKQRADAVSERDELAKGTTTSIKAQDASKDLLQDLESCHHQIDQLKKEIRLLQKSNANLQQNLEKASNNLEIQNESWKIKEMNLKRIVETSSYAATSIERFDIGTSTDNTHDDSITLLNETIAEKDVKISSIQTSLINTIERNTILTNEVASLLTESKSTRLQLEQLQNEHETLKKEHNSLALELHGTASDFRSSFISKRVDSLVPYDEHESLDNGVTDKE
ncbi:UNVERIFIED_CONTAM: hypothetical protein HDU68_001190, partial [Siphonaria sp. JEL0065]